MSRHGSPPNSPARKRQRLSSPTYDEQIEDLSQDDIAAFDKIDARLSQGSQLLRRTLSQEAKAQRLKAITDGLQAETDSSSGLDVPARSQDEISDFTNSRSDGSKVLPETRGDHDNPFLPVRLPSKPPAMSGFKTANSLLSKPTGTDSTSGFTCASHLASVNSNTDDHQLSPSPEPPTDDDYSSWFEPAPVLLPTGFQTAKFASASSLSNASDPPNIGFVAASNKGLIVPSGTAFAKATEKMKKIWNEDGIESIAPSNATTENKNTIEGPSSPVRPVLRTLENSFSPGTPTPSGFGRPPITNVDRSPATQLRFGGKAKPFKSPLINPLAVRSSQNTLGLLNSPLKSNDSIRQPFLISAPQYPPTSRIAYATPNRPLPDAVNLFHSPLQPLGLVPRAARSTPARFTTPFKPGMKPGEAGRQKLDDAARESRQLTPALASNQLTRGKYSPTRANKGKDKEKWKAFDLAERSNRQTLASCGLVPQSYTFHKLDAMGINSSELSRITPSFALYYSFHTPSAVPLDRSSSVNDILGSSAALEKLLAEGCRLVTKPWVDNHWCLILWKLAGMVALDPDCENIPTRKRWCWAEVMRQLLYRYERELNGGSRPPLRLITTQDAPAATPMILCVSNVIWSEPGLTDDGLPIETHPELEVTDGWYRLRAEVDQPLARAIRRGTIRVGRKIAIAGARLSSERKDPMEILECYNSVKLVLSGNSSHMAPWHAKMGFKLGPYISTLHSLTPDGGLVAVMDVVIVKTYPVAYLEFIEDEEGKRHREGPRNENEESKLNDAWKRRREVHELKLRSELEKKNSIYEGYIDRLEQRAGDRFHPGDEDSTPDHIEDLYDELEYPNSARAVLAGAKVDEAWWLARYIRERMEKDRERVAEEIEQELKNICPPREVRNFRILVVQDACTQRRPANRIAQLTVWDVLSLSLAEGSTAGAFEIGQRFLVTNLLPTQPTAWMDCEPGSEVYLSTRRDSKWNRIQQS